MIIGASSSVEVAISDQRQEDVVVNANIGSTSDGVDNKLQRQFHLAVVRFSWLALLVFMGSCYHGIVRICSAEMDENVCDQSLIFLLNLAPLAYLLAGIMSLFLCWVKPCDC
jgi:hypothetical protein